MGLRDVTSRCRRRFEARVRGRTGRRARPADRCPQCAHRARAASHHGWATSTGASHPYRSLLPSVLPNPPALPLRRTDPTNGPDQWTNERWTSLYKNMFVYAFTKRMSVHFCTCYFLTCLLHRPHNTTNIYYLYTTLIDVILTPKLLISNATFLIIIDIC